MGGTKYEVRIDGIDDNDEHGQSDWGAGEVRQVDLAGAMRYSSYIFQLCDLCSDFTTGGIEVHFANSFATQKYHRDENPQGMSDVRLH